MWLCLNLALTLFEVVFSSLVVILEHGFYIHLPFNIVIYKEASLQFMV